MVIDIELSDSIARPGQDIAALLTRQGDGPRPERLFLHHRIYEGAGPRPERQPVPLRWTGMVGEAVFQLPERGNYALTLGDDDLSVCRLPVTDVDPEPMELPYRHLACVGPESTVIRHMVADSSNPFSELVHGYRANVDYFMLPLNEPRHGHRRFERLFGDTVSPMIHPNGLQKFFPGLDLRDANWRTYSDETIRRLLVFVRRRWEEIGYKPLTILGTYTPSAGLIRVCKELGIHTLTNQAPDHYFRDGGWDIANPGMPDIPYFMSEEDFRCPEAPSAQGVFAAAQCQFVSPTSYRFWTDYNLDSSCFQREDRSFENGVTPWRAIDLLDAFVNGARASGGPDVVNVGIEAGETMWAKSILRINRALLRRSITLAQRGDGRVVLGTSEGLRRFALRDGGAVWPPTRLAVVPDIFAGRDFSRKPIIDVPTAMTDHADFHADFTAASPFPLALWPRKGTRGAKAFPGVGPTVPFSDIPDGWPGDCAPIPLGMKDFRVDWREVADGAEVEVSFHSAEAWESFPVMLWRPPLIPRALDGSYQGLQWMSARPRQGAVDAIMLVGQIREPGKVVWKAVIPGQPAASREEEVVELSAPSEGGLKLALMPQSLEEARHAYLVKTEAGVAEVAIDAGVDAVETHEGEACPPDRTFILTNESPYLRVWLKPGTPARVSARFTPQRGAGDFSVEADTALALDWVARTVLAPSEKLVLSLGCFRKCAGGTWGHPLQDDYLSLAADGLRYEANSLDFGQAWAPGHTSWNQPWNLVFTLLGAEGLKGRGARLHLHAYDFKPGTERLFMVTVNGRGATEDAPWRIPSGEAGRFDRSSVFSFPLADELLATGEIRVELKPSLPRFPLNDWIKDKAFSALLSDVWVSVDTKKVKEVF